MNAATHISYGHVEEVDLPFERVVEATRAALAAEGFTVAYETDMTAELKEELGQPFRPYRILGACNPELARLALSAEPQIGLLVPCNLVVQEIAGRTIVSAIDAMLLPQIAGNRSLEHIAADASMRIKRVLRAVARAK